MTKHEKFDPSAQIKEYRIQWKTADDVLGGTVTMRAAGKTYLPKFSAEEDSAYKIRLRNSFLYNAYAKNINKGVGKVFSREIVASEDNPPKVKEFLDDVDTTGRSATQFNKEVFKSGINHGVSYILTDYPVTTPNGTIEDERVEGAFPFWILIKATQVLEIRSERVKGKQTLTYFRFLETIDNDTGKTNTENPVNLGNTTTMNPTVYNTGAAHTTENKYSNQQSKIFMLDPVTEEVTYEIWRLDKQGEEFRYDAGSIRGMTRIPIAPFYTNRTDFFLGKPALMDLIQMNLRHWQSNSDQIHILTVTRLPILVITGNNSTTTDDGNVKSNKLEISPTSFVDLPAGGDVKYVEHTGKAMDAGFRDLQDLEKKMDSFGMELQLSEQPGSETATGRIIDASESNSMLKDMALSLRDTIIVSLEFVAEWLNIGIDQLRDITVNDDLGAMRKDPAEIQLLITLNKNGVISNEALVLELKNREVLSKEIEAETKKPIPVFNPEPDPIGEDE